MNFNCVGRDSKGQMTMKFHKPFTTVEKIQLLQRSILVNSFAYYELNENILSDFQYDTNAMQLVDLMKNHPDEADRTRYSEYFYDYCPTEEDVHYTSGFDLLERVKKADNDLFRHIWIDAAMALDMKRRKKEETDNEIR